MKYYINIGSNLGDRLANVDAAIAALQRRCDAVALRSAPIETEAWGFDSAETFVNVGVAIDSDLQPLEMLSALKDIENEIGTSEHRDAAGRYADRIIDLDIMAIDDLVIESDSLTVPHRHLPNREFFLVPLAEIAPHWQHPVLHKSAQQLLDELQGRYDK